VTEVEPNRSQRAAASRWCRQPQLAEFASKRGERTIEKDLNDSFFLSLILPDNSLLDVTKYSVDFAGIEPTFYRSDLDSRDLNVDAASLLSRVRRKIPGDPRQ
jgi:hypothetical protein